MAANELDVHQLRVPGKHPTTFAACAAIGKLTATPPPVRHGHPELVLEPLESSARQEI